jgi:hypothetical protein
LPAAKIDVQKRYQRGNYSDQQRYSERGPVHVFSTQEISQTDQ